MQFSKRSEYGVRVMTELAVQYGRGPLPLSEIARGEGMPLAYLEQIVAPLRRGGLVISHQGVRGGYELGRPPAEIAMSEVLGILEGQMAPMLCAPLDGATALCDRESICGSKLLWTRVRDAISVALRETTLAELAGAVPQARRGPDAVALPMAAAGNLAGVR